MGYVVVYTATNKGWRTSLFLDKRTMNLDSFEAARAVTHQWFKETGRNVSGIVCIVPKDTYDEVSRKHSISAYTVAEHNDIFIQFAKDHLLTRADVWIEGLSDPATPEHSMPVKAKPRREADHAPLWWDLKNADGTIKVSPEMAMDAVRALCKGG